MLVWHEWLPGHSSHPINAKTTIIFQIFFSFRYFCFIRGMVHAHCTCYRGEKLTNNLWKEPAPVLRLRQEILENPSVIQPVIPPLCHFTHSKQNTISNVSIPRKCQRKCTSHGRTKQGWQLHFHFFCFGLFRLLLVSNKESLCTFSDWGKQWSRSFSSSKGVLIARGVSV